MCKLRAEQLKERNEIVEKNQEFKLTLMLKYIIFKNNFLNRKLEKINNKKDYQANREKWTNKNKFKSMIDEQCSWLIFTILSNINSIDF